MSNQSDKKNEKAASKIDANNDSAAKQDKDQKRDDTHASAKPDSVKDSKASKSQRELKGPEKEPSQADNVKKEVVESSIPSDVSKANDAGNAGKKKDDSIQPAKKVDAEQGTKNASAKNEVAKGNDSAANVNPAAVVKKESSKNPTQAPEQRGDVKAAASGGTAQKKVDDGKPAATEPKGKKHDVDQSTKKNNPEPGQSEVEKHSKAEVSKGGPVLDKASGQETKLATADSVDQNVEKSKSVDQGMRVENESETTISKSAAAQVSIDTKAAASNNASTADQVANDTNAGSQNAQSKLAGGAKAKNVSGFFEATIPPSLSDMEHFAEIAARPEFDYETRQDVISSVQSILKPKGEFLSRTEMLHASKQLQKVMPYNFEAWRLHADILLNALQQLETRQIMPDDSFQILAIPLRENDIRDAAEAALRQCAHFAGSEEQRIQLVDEANSVRRLTWF